MRIDDRNVRMGDIIAFDWKDSNNNIQTGIAEHYDAYEESQFAKELINKIMQD